MKKILITGCNGYIGIELVKRLLKEKKFLIYGVDNNYFTKSVEKKIKEKKKFKFLKKDIRKLNLKKLINFDTIIHLAAISNDPIGNKFYQATKSINETATKKLIISAKKNGIKQFIFLSSCSVYGFSKNNCKENSPTKPLTAYSKSKIFAEKILKKESDNNFKSISLRLATACGYSDNPRFDLVLNDFIYSGLTNKKIIMNSTGNALRPLIDVKDIVSSIYWIVENKNKVKSSYSVFNVGNNKNNFKIIDLAKIISKKLGGIEIITNEQNNDKRSYKANFSKFNRLTKNKIVNTNLNKTIFKLINMTKTIIKKNKPKKNYIRLNVLEKKIEQKQITKNLTYN